MRKTLGAITIDDESRTFKISGETSAPKKGGLAKGLMKGTLAISTMGLSILAEKAVKAGANAVRPSQWYSFDELVDYHIRTDNERVASSVGGRVRVAKGVSVGERVRTSKSVTQAMSIVVQLDNLSNPVVTIPITTKPLKGAALNNAQRMADETVAALDYIIRHR